MQTHPSSQAIRQLKPDNSEKHGLYSVRLSLDTQDLYTCAALRVGRSGLVDPGVGQRRRTAAQSAARPLSAAWGRRYVGPVNKPVAVPDLEAVELLASVLRKNVLASSISASSGPDFRNVTPSILPPRIK